MKTLNATFISSHDAVSKCPPAELPEFAFIGRSNVGKSSLINMLVQRKNLAKISARPGKTQTINHYLVNDKWYLVDLPGYGYAAVSKSLKKGWGGMIEEYLLQRENLYCLFVLLDARLPPQPIDMDFLNWVGSKQIPLCVLLTKSDKLSNSQLNLNRRAIEKRLAESWAPLPPLFVTSAPKKTGRGEVIDFIDAAITR